MADQAPPPQGAPKIEFKLPNGQRPSEEQIKQLQAQIEAEAAKNGMTVQEYITKIQQQHLAQQQAQQAAAQQGGGQVQQPPQQPPQQQQQQAQQPIQPGPPKPEALAVAAFLKNQDLKMRTCILNGQRKDMFKGKLIHYRDCNVFYAKIRHIG